jgi:hypothetical protein
MAFMGLTFMSAAGLEFLDFMPDLKPPHNPNLDPHGEEALAPSRTMRPQLGLIVRDARKSALSRMRGDHIGEESNDV